MLSDKGVNPFFVPDFDDVTGAADNAYDASFFQNYPVVDGVFSWESAWPQESEDLVNVSSAKDQTSLQAARAAGLKLYLHDESTAHYISVAYEMLTTRRSYSALFCPIQAYRLRPELVSPR